jgi:glycosyltransferase involved in cell wall biosynthesis/cytochrome c-type biogenesis protein CcmH/NrfG
MDTWQGLADSALERFQAGDVGESVKQLAAAILGAGNQRGPLAFVISPERGAAPDVADRLVLAYAKGYPSPSLVADAEAVLLAHGREGILEELRRTATPAPDDLLREGQALLGQGNLVAARERFEALVAARPNEYLGHFKIGAIAGLQGDLARAEAAYHRALALKPDALDVQAELGLLNWRRYKDADVVTQLVPVCRAWPTNLKLASYLAEAHAALGQDDAIADLFEGALRAGAPWTTDRLLPIAREINVVPACRKGLFRAAARVAGGGVAEQLARRGDAEGPQSAPSAPEPWKSLLEMPLPKRISACMIVKNEEDMLERLLASVQPMVDEMIVVDTGSTDKTVEIAESFGARVFHFDWCDDFGAARNESLKHASGDWIVIADADSEMDLASRRSLRRFLQGPSEENGAPLAYAMQLVDHLSPDPTIVNSRSYFLAIFPNDPALRYVGAIHEQLTDHQEPPRGLKVRSLNDIVCHHYGYAKAVIARKDKKSRNMRILLKELEHKPEDAFVRYNVALQLRLEGQLGEAVGHVRECLRLCAARGESFRPPYLESAHILLADLLVRQGDFPRVAEACEEGLKTFPNCFDLLGRLGMARLATNRTEQAFAPLEAAMRRKGTIGASGSNGDFTGWLSESLLAVAHWRMGDAEGCDRHLKHAWETCTDRQAMAERFVQMCGLLLGTIKASQALLARVGVRLALDIQPAAPVAEPVRGQA